MFNTFSDWSKYKLIAESEEDEDLPQSGDVVIKQPSAIFWNARKPKTSWVKCPSNRSLDNTSMTMYVIIGKSQDGKVPVINTTKAKNRKQSWISTENLFDVTDIYEPEDRKGRKIWVKISPDSKYREIYDFWKQECLEEHIVENVRYKKMWKVDTGEAKLYQTYKVEG